MRLFNNKLPLFKKGSSGEMDFRPESRINNTTFLYGFIFFVSLSFLVIVLRLFQLTIVKGGYYARLSEENRVKEIIIEAKRGKIIDRKGFTIAENQMADTTKEEEKLTSSRLYQYQEAIAHLIGYRQLADEKDLREDECLIKLHLSDKVGKKGVEKLLECRLRGRQGKKLIEVDAHGRYIKTLTVVPPVDGETVQLAVDLELQKKAYELIKDKKGVIVGLKPQTGEVIVFVSSPAFDPQSFEDGRTNDLKFYLNNKDKPLFNRAAEGTYPPGSLFKLVLATGALEEKKITQETTFEDTGIIKAGPLTFGNWYFLQYGKTEGLVDIVKAIRRSNDIFFYRVGEKLGPEKIKTWAERLGFGRITGIGLDEAEGLISSPFWKKETLKENWYLGDTYNLSIGQGYLLVTPLQVAQATGVFANKGYLCQPKLLKNEKPDCQKLPVSQKTLALITQGMKEACSPGGTGWPLFEFKVQNRKIQTACKTGTAEAPGKKEVSHAWFTVFAPYENSEIVLTVLVEEGGQGSDVAGPIAKEILKTYFERGQ